MLGFLLLGRIKPSNLRALFGLTVGHFLLLREYRQGLLLRDAQLLLLGGEVFLRNLYRGVLFDSITLFGAQLRFFGELGQTFRVKGVVGIKKLHRRLVNPRERNRFQFKTIFHQVFLNRVLYGLDEVLTLVEHLLHRHRHGGGAQRIDEFIFHQFF